MKIQVVGIAIAITLTVHAKDSFQNLDFEATSLSPTTPPSLVTTSEALPGWNVFEGLDTPITQVGYGDRFESSPVALFTTNEIFGTSIEGRLSLYLTATWPGMPPIPEIPPISIAQTGVVPKNARYIFFKARPGFPLPTVSLGGVGIFCNSVSTHSNYTLFAGDVSRFAGQSRELRFEINRRGVECILDSIGFSSQPIAAASLVAARGDQITNGVTLDSVGSPAMDAAGDVAFRAVLKGNNVKAEKRIAIVIYSNGIPNVVVRTGDIDPNTGTIFSRLSDPILSSTGVLVFLGGLRVGTGNVTEKNSIGIWEYQNEQLSLIALSGTKAPNFGTLPESLFKSFNQIAVNDWGGVLFTASIEGTGRKPSEALFASRFSGGLFLSQFTGEEFNFYGYPGFVAELGVLNPLPHVCGQGRTLAGNGDYISSLKLRALPSDTTVLRPFHFGLFFQKDDSADESGAGFPGGPPPPYTAQFKLHEAIINNSNQVVVRATVVDEGYNSTNNTVIAMVPNGLLTWPFQFLVRTGDIAPDASGATGESPFSNLGDPVLNNNGHIAFLASVRGPKPSNTLGIWSDADGTMKQVVAQGDIEPGGSGGKFLDFNQIILPDAGGVVIEASVSGLGGRKQGLWVIGPDGLLQRLLLEGDNLDFHGTLKTLKHFNIFKITPHFSGQTRSYAPSTGNLVFQAVFDGGSWGIYQITNPSSWQPNELSSIRWR
jgi:hypothetical protein